MLKKLIAAVALLGLASVFLLSADARAEQGATSKPGDDLWYETAGDEVGIHLYFVWSPQCPHCLAAQPFIEGLAESYSWLHVHSLPVTDDRAVDEAIEVADSISFQIQGVPTFMFCERARSGYDTDATSGEALREELLQCRRDLLPAPAPAPEGEGEGAEAEETFTVPFLGKITSDRFSLPVFTVVLAGLDAFNPCAFFVLLFLLSLLVHARSRARMALIGGLFVLVSGLVYFAFMAAWLSFFTVTGSLDVITPIAGGIAVVVGLANVKDFLWFGRGPSLSIPDEAKPKLTGRMRSLSQGSKLPALIAGTLGLAVVANSYELLCTAGFPMVFTRVLTLNEVGTSTHYLYLALYNLIYVIPLLIIVSVFVWTLGRWKLTEEQGRFLKLLSGTMMLGLGVVLLAAPDWLTNIGVAVGLLLSAIVVATAATIIRHRWNLARPRARGGV